VGGSRGAPRRHAGALGAQAGAEGQANQAVVALLAEWLGVPRSSVRLVRGARARLKVVEVPLERWDEVLRRLPPTRGTP
jgi:uncharacterized protein YggU (UPF0235/DUF167 family)